MTVVQLLLGSTVVQPYSIHAITVAHITMTRNKKWQETECSAALLVCGNEGQTVPFAVATCWPSGPIKIKEKAA